MAARKTPIRILRMDNAGENIAVQKKCTTVWNITVEKTPPDTPKMNGKIELAFAIQWEKAKILMQAAGLKQNDKCNKKILIRAIKTASFLTEQAPSKRSKI